jgi:hypothetical protein
MEFVSNRGSSFETVGRKGENIILHGIENARNLGDSKWEHMLGRIDCALPLCDKMTYNWDDIYLPQYPCLAVDRLSLLSDGLGSCHRSSLEMRFKAEIKRTESCAWRRLPRECGDALGSQDQLNWEINSKSFFERDCRCNWKPRLSELINMLQGCE